MLEANIIEQLKSVYSGLERAITLVVHASAHEKQAELEALVREVAATSSRISMRKVSQQTAIPTVSLFVDGQNSGVTFRGAPGGHEFTSFVLAILNADGKGRLPDAGILGRVKRLRGPIHLTTYVSLSCENCPEVVQALNIMALQRDDFFHTVVDGGLVQEEVETLRIQGVPSVMSQGTLVSSGKVSLADLLSKLEAVFGVEDATAQKSGLSLGDYDVVVVGAGPAGASAAIYSARKGLKTAMIGERMGGQVQDTKGIENLIGVSYTDGAQLAHQLFEHVSGHDITFLEHRRVKDVSTGDLKRISLESGEFLRAKSLIIATGAKWREMNVPGEREYLGRGVAFCPHCDGPYFKGKDIAVIGGGNSGVEAAIDLAGTVKSVTLLEFNQALKADQVLVTKLESLSNARVIKNARTNRVLGDHGKVTALEYEDRTTAELKTIPLDGVFVQIGLLPNSAFVKDLVETNRFGEIIVDEKCRTTSPGIYAAGDVTTVPFKQIIIAMGEGAKAALSSFEDLMLK